MSAWHPMAPEARHYRHRLDDTRIEWPERERVLAREDRALAWGLFTGRLLGSWLLLALAITLARLLL